MLDYQKGPEPPGLAALRATPGADWASVDGTVKAALREALGRDQRRLCAYCERRITPELQGSGPTMTVEHWTPRSSGIDQLVWGNLLGVCRGTTGGARHCDAARGNEPLVLHPVAGRGQSPRGSLRYEGSGRITSPDPRANRDVDETLNLNAPPLTRARKAVLDGLRRRLPSPRDRDRLRRELDRLNTVDPAPEHIEATRYLLWQWLQ